MVMMTLMPRIVNSGTSHEGKVFDNPGYDNALKESGWTAEEAQQYWSDVNNTDPYAKAGNDIGAALVSQAPKIAIEDGKISISAPQAVLDSPLVSQLQEQLQTLKGYDLKTPEAAQAIDALNKEINDSLKNWMIEETFGWTPEEFNDYQYAIQTINVPNPMQSSNKLKAKRPGADFYTEEDGTIMQKTPQEWIEYWRDIYNTDQRTDMFKKSLQSDDPYERVMALIMSKGSERPTYGYDTGERIGQGIEAFRNQMAKLPYGIFRLVSTPNNVKRVEDFGRNFNIPVESFISSTVPDEGAFNEMKKSIEGKSWEQLDDNQKAFMIELGSSIESNEIRPVDRGLLKEDATKDLDQMTRGDNWISGKAVERILEKGSYEDYKKLSDDYNKFQASDQANIYDAEERLANNAIWSDTEQNIGNFAGVVGRFIWENALGKAATGKSMAKISDALGEKAVAALNKIGVSPVSKLGTNALNFTARLAGTVPEDIVQTSIDNILTYNEDENKNLFSPERMSEDFKMNLIFMSAFNAGMAGLSTVKQAMLNKAIKESKDLAQVIDIGAASLAMDDAKKVADTIKRGGRVVTDGDSVYAESVDGKKTELKNTTPEQAGMVQRTLFDWADNKTTKSDGVTGTNRISEAIEGVESAAKKSDEGGATVKNEIDTSAETTKAELPDYNFKTVDEIFDPNVKVVATEAGIGRFVNNAKRRIMRDFSNILKEFHNKFGDVQASDFHWIRTNIEEGKTPAQIVGTKDPSTGRLITQNTIDAAKWWAEIPVAKRLRMSSRKSLGKGDDDYNKLGYLPRTSYDPSAQSIEDVVLGALWKKSTGKAVRKDGEYVGYGGTLTNAFETFVNNMLWDMRSKDVLAAKMAEEALLDEPVPGTTGKTRPITTEQAVKAAETAKNIQDKVNNSGSSRDFAKLLEKDGGYDKKEWDEADAKFKEEAPKSGIGRAMHDGYADVYIGANKSKVVSQPTKFGNSFSQQSDIMKKIQIGNGMSMYDWGGADLVYASQNANYFVNLWMRNGAEPSQFREMAIKFIMSHSHRSKPYAESVADKWLTRIASSDGGMTKGNVMDELTKCMRSEAWSRLRKWNVMAEYSGFSKSTEEFINKFMYSHMQMDGITNSKTIGQKMTNLMSRLTEYRYDALFYGNFKNALLQLSELSRLFTVFKWGDVGTMLKKIATDANFRDKVNMYVDAVAPKTTLLEADLYGDYGKLGSEMKVEQDGVTFGKIKGTAKEAKDIADKIGLAPINTAEALKNRTMVAALVQEADRKGLTGDTALQYIRNKFERVALAANEMGQIGLATNPMAKPFLFLQNFQIRELGMHYYNIKDATGMVDGGKLKKTAEAVKYLSKVLGSKMAITLILGRIGYSASQTLGLDPFGILNNYTGLSEDEMNSLDKQITNGMLTPFFAGGMTSLISDMYFMARKAYEDAENSTISEDAEKELKRGDFLSDLRFWEQTKIPDQWGSPEYWVGQAGSNFLPGSNFMNRLGQMNEMMDTGWALSSTGGKMYTAPDDAFNSVLGYLFGRGATQNALQYNQTYGDDLGQTIDRTAGKTFQNLLSVFGLGQGYEQFNPIDDKNYSDWFKGNDNDLQQFEKGKRYFQKQRDAILDAYQSEMNKGWRSDEELAEAKNDMETKLDGLYDQLDRFVDAYEKKNGSITPKMVKDIVNILNTSRYFYGDNADETEKRRQEGYDEARERYAMLGLPAVGTYSGPTRYNETAKVKYEGSPQWRIAKSGKYNLQTELAAVLAAGDAVLQDYRKELKDMYSEAVQSNNYTEFNKAQGEYLKAFDNVVGPIVATYGVGALNDDEVKAQLEKMLSTSSNSGKNIGNLIPYKQYATDKYGRTRSMPNESVNVVKWAMERYGSDTFKNPTIRSYSSAQDDINAIKRLSASGQNDMARARALSLKVRIDNQKRSLDRSDYQWLLDFLNNGGQK